jgi:hypothetical protein
VLGFDYFAARCTSTQPASDVEAIDRWVEANAVERVRERIAALERDPSEGARVGQLRRAVDANMAKLTGPPCGLALAVIRTREAQFATAAPAVLAALKRAPAAPSSPATPARAAASPAASRTAAPRIEASALVAQIDSVGFGSRATMGIGGFMAMAVYPIVLFKNGEALTDIEQLGTMTGLAASQRGDPSDWTRWRRAGSKVELESKGEWKALPFTATYATLPPNFRLDGRFRSLSGSGTVAVGGTTSVAAWSEYRFFSDGTLVRGGGAGGSTEFGDASVVTRSVPPDRRGRYDIDGLILHIAYDDGTEERRILVTDPSDATSPIWLDGVSYTFQRPRK